MGLGGWLVGVLWGCALRGPQGEAKEEEGEAGVAGS